MTEYTKKEYRRISKENPTLTMQEKLALVYRYIDAYTTRLCDMETRIIRKHGNKAAYQFRCYYHDVWSSWSELYDLKEMGYISTRF